MTSRVTATVLASLRFWEKAMQLASADPEIQRSWARAQMPHFADEVPLCAEEIDALCEQINLGVSGTRTLTEEAICQSTCERYPTS